MDQKKRIRLITAIIILSITVIGLLAYVFWHNFYNANADTKKSDNASISTKQVSNSKPIDYETYETDMYGLSFQYPSNWTVEKESKNNFDPDYNRTIDIKNNGQVVATLVFAVTGLGGSCDSSSSLPTYTVLDTEKSSIASGKPVSVSFMVTPSSQSDGSYKATYGLTDTYTRLGDYPSLCLVYFNFLSNIYDKNQDLNYGISFGNGVTFGNKTFSSLDDAKAYIASDEYKEIKKMLLSLSY